MPQLTVQRLFEDRRDKLALTWIGGQAGAARVLPEDALNRPGVGLVGHLNLIHPILIQALGTSDIEYLDRLDDAQLVASLDALCKNETLAIFLCDGVDAPSYLIQAADKYETPLFSSLKKKPRLCEFTAALFAARIIRSHHLARRIFRCAGIRHTDYG